VQEMQREDECACNYDMDIRASGYRIRNEFIRMVRLIREGKIITRIDAISCPASVL